jgi:capsule polysaccharide export protein KpsE/RkpR
MASKSYIDVKRTGRGGVSDNDAQAAFVPPELQDGETIATDLRDGYAERGEFFATLAELWSRRQFLFRKAVIAMVASALISLLIPARYESTTRLMPPDNRSTSGLAMLSALAGGGGGNLGLAGSIGADLLGMKSSGALFVGILRSRTVGDRIVSQFDLRTHYRVSRWEDARKKLEDRTNIEEDRKNGIISISVTDHDPKLAAAMARAYVEQLDRLVSQLTTSSAHRERVFLEDRLNGVKQDLDAAQKSLSEFSSKNTMLDPKDQGKAMVEAAAGLQGQLIASQAELEGLKQIYSDNNVRVKTIQGRIGELRRQLNLLGVGAADGSTQPSDSIYPSIRKLPLLGATYIDLYRQTKIQEAVFETLTSQYELAKVEEAKEIPSVRVLDPPAVPERKSFPPRIAITVAGTFLTFIALIAWFLLRRTWERMDGSDPRVVFARAVHSDVVAFASELNRRGRAPLRERYRTTDPPSDDAEHD